MVSANAIRTDFVPLDVDRAFREHGAFVARVVQRLAGEGAHVDDLVQEIFVVAFKKRNDFEGRSSVRTWLYAIARNLCFRHIRGRKRFALFEHRFARALEPEPVAMPQAEVERRESIARVHRVLKQLPLEQREVAVLYELEGVEGREIGELIGIPLGTVWTRLAQARKSVEKLMRRELAREAAP
jgi:RNA polymerase sigma-70 factor, ECF subfamily